MQITSGRIRKAIKTVVYGEEGVGKSTFASQFPGPLFIDTEQSTVHMDVRRLPAPESWGELMQEVAWAIEHPDEMRTLVIDTADWAELLCTAAVCQKAGKSGVEDFGYGKGYTYVSEEFARLLGDLNRLVDRGVNVTITAHAKMRKFEQPDESGAYDRWEMKLSKQVAPLLKEWADLLLFAQFETVVVKNSEGKVKATQGTKRIMRTTHHACWDAKNRFGLPDKLPFDFAEIAQIIIGKSGEHDEPVSQQPDTPKPVPAVATSVASPEPAKSEAQSESPVVDAYDSVPAELATLMRDAQVTPEELIYAVAQKGYYPTNTPIANYDPEFVHGVLIGAWPQVLMMIQMNRNDTPF